MAGSCERLNNLLPESRLHNAGALPVWERQPKLRRQLTSALFSEVNPIPVKAALNMIGFKAGLPRLPLIEMSKTGKENLRNEMINYGLKLI